MLAPVLALPGCTATHVAPLLPLCLQSHGSRYDGTDAPAGSVSAGWWQCLGDAQLSALIERAPAPSPPPTTSARGRRSAEIASRYIALRERQTALVLLAEREDIDSRLVAFARQHVADGTAPRRQVETAEAQLARTRADQARIRARIAALSDGLAVISDAAPGTLASLPGGPIPLPPPALEAGDQTVPIAWHPDIRLATCKLFAARCVRARRNAALADYRAKELTAARAQSLAEHARAIAASQDMRAGGGTVAPGEALEADREALDALQAEEQARAAMTQAYVAVARSQRRD